MRSLLRKASAILNRGKNSDEPRDSGVKAQQTQDILNNDPPGGAPPTIPRTTDEFKDIPKSILAFRTITTLLEQIQQERKFQVLPSKRPPQPDRLELKISNAFSTIAVIDNEVVAVVTKRTSEVLEITACTQAPANKDSVITPSQPGLMSQIWHLHVTQNYRRDDREPSSLPVGKPIINDARTLAALELADDELKVWVDECWSHLTMSRHLWILGKLLNIKRLSAKGPEKSSADDSTRFLRYVIATSYPKMIRRLNHKTLSLPLIAALEQIQTFTFEEPQLDQEQNGGTESDILFMTNFLPHAAPELHIAIPKIMEKTTVPMGIEDRSAFRLYTQDTCVEFHKLFMRLLLCFQSSLKDLEDCRRGLTAPTPGSQAIKDQVECVLVYGHALHRLTRGAALPMHLRSIAPLLRGMNLGSKITMPTPAPDEEQEEPDEELKAVQPFVEVDGIETPLWQSYLDWLRLMVAHFDAADILLTYVTGPNFVHDNISIQVLFAPPVDQRLLPWKELLADPTFFPTTTTATSPHKSQASITNGEILEFLSNGFAHSARIKGIKTRWNRSGGPTTRDVKDIKAELQRLIQSSFEDWRASATKVFQALDNSASPPLLESEEFRKITEDINSLVESSALFASLDASQRVFKGTLHCEACLASLLDGAATFSGDILAQMKGFGPVIGISKRCCPVCHYLLSFLSAGGKPFVVRGYHNTVTACTLPAWLPERIVNSLNNHFGDLLRRELVEFLDHSALFRNRQSNGSHRLSSDSTEPAHETQDPATFRFTALSKVKGLGSASRISLDL